MNAETVIFVILPYISLTILVVGLIWRRRTDRYGWNARSTQLLESKTLRFGSVLFHLGVLAAIGGHVMGLLIPESWTSAVGITDSMYHVVAVIGGISAGTAVIIGFAALIYRRIRFPRIRVTTTNMDIAVFGLLAFGIVTGMLNYARNTPEEWTKQEEAPKKMIGWLAQIEALAQLAVVRFNLDPKVLK